MSPEEIKREQAVIDVALQRDIPISDEIEETVYIDICRDIIVKQKDVTRHLSTVMQAINDSKTL